MDNHETSSVNTTQSPETVEAVTGPTIDLADLPNTLSRNDLYHPGIEKYTNVLTSVSEILGHVAFWAIVQSPWIVPNNLTIVLNKLHHAIMEDDTYTKEGSDGWIRLKMNNFEFGNKLLATLMNIPEFVEWNNPIVDDGSVLHFTSRFDTKRDPRTDFICLQPLARNAAMALYQHYIYSSIHDNSPYLKDKDDGSEDKKEEAGDNIGEGVANVN